jgi:hypothetical protein
MFLAFEKCVDFLECFALGLNPIHGLRITVSCGDLTNEEEDEDSR